MTIALPPDPDEYGPPPGRRMPRTVVVGALIIGFGLGVGGPLLAVELREDARAVVAEFVSTDAVLTAGELVASTPDQRGTSSYEGYGAWVDVFDFSPPYAGPSPPVTPGDLAAMADAGVRTLYLQAARLDDRSPNGIEDPWILAEFLLAAHAREIDVVAWYLPRWSEDDADLERLRLLDRFEVLGHRFDGVAVDIEWRGDIDVAIRNERLIALSSALRREIPDGPLGAIVLPPVLIEVVNEDFWPDFPWRGIAELYDVWLPMSYWSFRSEASGYRDGYTYNEESVRRLRNNLGMAEALVHPIGGIGGTDGVDDPPAPPEPLTTIDEIEAFVRSLTDTGSIGGSIYDWNTLEESIRAGVGPLVEAAVGPAIS